MNNSRKPYASVRIAAAGMLATALTANAESFWIDAPVIDVEPRLRVVQVTVPQEVCWQEPVQQAGYYGYESHTPKVLGGILGGVVGNQFGGGRGRDVMTVAGALLGASVGNDVAKQRRPYYPGRTVMENRCEVEQLTHEEQRSDGYLVTYEYAGQTFTTLSPVDPGERIRVRVQVDPVTYNGPQASRHPAYGAPAYRQRYKR